MINHPRSYNSVAWAWAAGWLLASIGQSISDVYSSPNRSLVASGLGERPRMGTSRGCMRYPCVTAHGQIDAFYPGLVYLNLNPENGVKSMSIAVNKINTRNVGDVNRCDGEFSIDAKLVVHVENDRIQYSVIEVPGSQKRYEKEDVDYTTYIDNPDRTVFLAYLEGQIAGQIILHKNWNNYAYIEDITVDVKFRKLGIGKELMSQARDWAQRRNLAGIMAETQNNNVNACRFYESCGFQLFGFDTHLYRGIDRETDEIALFWYLIFENHPAH